jgi:hypothetical protein
MNNLIVNKNFHRVLILVAFYSLFLQKLLADGGMYPINDLYKLDLKKAGLQISVKDIYNPDSISLLQAIVNLGGCTGSFVSDDGLILTNHHCVFSALRTYSTNQKNLMETGFLAGNKPEELPMKGMVIKIMVNYEDVSNKVLQGVNSYMDPIARRMLIQKNMAGVIQLEQAKTADYSVDVSEMLTGKSYILFRYQDLKDVRIVYVPQRQIGEFGGETDNWMWPRHSGDFAFARAYVSPDGKPAEYSITNVPYKPKKHLQMNAQGVKENDFIFILGYPGRTYRNRPAEFIKYMENYQLPFIANFFEFRIASMEHLIKQNSDLKIKYDPQIKSLANTSKNFRGKIKTLKAISLYKKKKLDEQHILSLLQNDPNSANDFRKLMDKIDSLYNRMYTIAERSLWYGQVFQTSAGFDLARYLVNYANRIQNSPNLDLKQEQEKAYFDAVKIIGGYNGQTDSVFFKEMLIIAHGFANKNSQLEAYFGKDKYLSNLQAFLNNAYKSKFLIPGYEPMLKKLLSDPKKILKSKDPFINLYHAIFNDYFKVDSLQKVYLSSIDALMPLYIDFKMKATGENFIPDANSTMRFTYGYIRGYYPVDAIYNAPFTSLRGIPEKISIGGEYVAYDKLITQIDNLQVSILVEPALKSVPVNMLYNADTTGGNSGSPVFNGKGELIGLNFDRAFEATVNDFEWNESYSRSIACDVRYILFVAKYVDNADYLLKELNVAIN